MANYMSRSRRTGPMQVSINNNTRHVVRSLLRQTWRPLIPSPTTTRARDRHAVAQTAPRPVRTLAYSRCIPRYARQHHAHTVQRTANTDTLTGVARVRKCCTKMVQV